MTLGQWNAHREAGRTREERAERLAEVPVELRAAVRSHVETCFLLRRRAKARKAYEVPVL